MTRSPKLRPFAGFIMALLFLGRGIGIFEEGVRVALAVQLWNSGAQRIKTFPQVGFSEYPTYETFSLG
jgi:hypothetical protein